MFLTYTSHPESPLKERQIYINVLDILSVKTASILGEVRYDVTELKLKPNVLVSTEDNEKTLTYIWVNGDSNGIVSQINEALSNIRLLKA